MKRIGYLREQITALNNLYEAYHKACRGKKRKKEVLHFAEHFDENIRQLRDEMLSGTVSVGNYNFFTIHDPKERMICAAPFRERILQHAIMNVCHLYFDKQLIDTTYATRKGKGIYAALEHARQAMTHYACSLKLDFRKYYDTIDHEVLKLKLRRMFKDRWLLEIFDRIIDSYEVMPGKGLPIGNLTSQYFANLYLSELDHRIKEIYRVPIYIRYMDDMLLFAENKERLRWCLTEITAYSEEVLKLKLKPPVFRNSKDGQVFLGYRVLPYHIKLSGRSKRRFRTKLIKYEQMLANYRWTEEHYEEHILPLLSFVQHAKCYGFRQDCIKRWSS